MTTPAAPAARYHRWPAVLGVAAATLLVLVATAEVIGWPFLADPLQRWLSNSLQRQVSVAIDGRTPASVSVRLLGRLRLEAPQIEIGAPAWSHAPYMLRARDAVMSLHYADLWRAQRGEPLRIHMLEATELDVEIERLADGRASWQFGAGPARNEPPLQVLQMPLFDRLRAETGTLRYSDDALGLRVAMRLAPIESSTAPVGGVAGGLAAAEVRTVGTQAELRGVWHGQPLVMTIRSKGGLAWTDRDASAQAVPVVLDGSVGDRSAAFAGEAVDVLGTASKAMAANAAR